MRVVRAISSLKWEDRAGILEGGEDRRRREKYKKRMYGKEQMAIL